jgi:hypothetical protein
MQDRGLVLGQGTTSEQQALLKPSVVPLRIKSLLLKGGWLSGSVVSNHHAAVQFVFEPALLAAIGRYF